MRKYLLSGILMAMLVCLFTMPAIADTIKIIDQDKIKVVVFKIEDVNYYLEETDGTISKTKMDAAPYIKQGRTFVPVRYLANALGLTDNKIHWDGAKREVALRKQVGTYADRQQDNVFQLRTYTNGRST